MSAEQQLRDALEAMGFPEAQGLSSGDLMAVCVDGLKDFVPRIAREESGEWIKVSERLPESGQCVIAYSATAKIYRWLRLAIWTVDRGFYEPIAGVPITPSHWTPIPDPPEES